MSLFQLHPNLLFRLCHEAEIRLNVVVVLGGGQDLEFPHDVDRHDQAFEERELVARALPLSEAEGNERQAGALLDLRGQEAVRIKSSQRRKKKLLEKCLLYVFYEIISPLALGVVLLVHADGSDGVDEGGVGGN